MRLSRIAWLACLLVSGVLQGAVSRDEEPVLVLGSVFQDLQGRAISDLGLFRFTAGTGFEPVPFQVDERVPTTFNPGTPFAFEETIYDVTHQEDGILDADDELAVLFADAGPAAPEGTPWPAGSDAFRYDIELRDPRPSAPPGSRWLYLFAGTGLARSPVSYVTWNASPSGAISTDALVLEYQDRWLLTGFRILAPCGDGSDLLDRLKGRAYPEEDEENWNTNSSWMGGIVGPVRAIRYVRGATSAVNTIHHDVIYRRFWHRQVNLRVHTLTWASLYVDWRPQGVARFYSPLLRAGVPVDGAPDVVPDTWVDWILYASARGGVLMLHDFPPSSLYARRTILYRDDQAYDDQVPVNPTYGDEDDSAYGDMGIRLDGIQESNTTGIPMGFQIWPLCGGVGDAGVGDAYDEIRDIPLQVRVAEEGEPLPVIRSLGLARQDPDMVLTWEAVAGVLGYRVYGSFVPSAAPASWTLLADTPATTWRDPGAGVLPTRYYSVVAYGPLGEGPW